MTPDFIAQTLRDIERDDHELGNRSSAKPDADDDRRGTSTSDAEAPLREIGRVAFGIRYPKDITPRRNQPRRLSPGDTDGRILARILK